MVRNSLVFLPSKVVVQSQEREFLNLFIHFPFTAARYRFSSCYSLLDFSARNNWANSVGK